MKITVFGGGSWGLALASVLSDNSHKVLVYDVNEKIINKINNLHICAQLDEYIPKDIKATTSIKEAVDYSDIYLFTIPTKVIRFVIKDMLTVLNKKVLIINGGKGMEPKSFLRVSEIIYEMIPNEYIKGFVALSGPSHAEEVITKKITTVCAASEVEEYSLLVQKLFSNESYFRIYTSPDLIGAELGGALKNIYAVASGIMAGNGVGDNGRAALITRALVEMKRFYKEFGADEDTLIGLTGLGDLIVTCTSPHSRNFQAGYQIGHGKDFEETINSMTMTVEGVKTCEAAYLESKKRNIDTPIIDALYDIIFNKHISANVLANLMKRDLKSE